MLLATTDGAKIGALKYLNIWDYPWWGVALFLFAIDFGVIFFVMMGPIFERRWDRFYYPSFLINDILLIPLFGAVVKVVLGHMEEQDAWYTSSWFHWHALAAGFVISFFLEATAVRDGVFTMSEELSPSKLYHTIIFGFMGYWLITGAVTIVVGRRPLWAVVAAGVLFVLWVLVIAVADPKLGPLQNQGEKAHFSWSWGKFEIVDK